MPAPLPRRRPSRPVRAHRAPRLLSRDAIVDAALRVLDAEGLDAVTMRRVSEEIGTGPASLYAHVRDKDDLVDALLDRVIGEVDISQPPDPDRWQEQLIDFAIGARVTFARHRDIARASLGTIPTGPRALPVVDWMLGVLRAGGVPDQVAAWTADVLSLYFTATAYEEALEAARRTPEDTEQYHDQVHERFLALDPHAYPNVTALLGALTAGDGDERFRFGLDMIVRGIASTVGEPAPRARSRPTRRRSGS